MEVGIFWPATNRVCLFGFSALFSWLLSCVLFSDRILSSCWTVSFPEIRYRYWNGYMLFYESMSPVPEADQLDGRRYSSGSDMS